MSSKTSTLECDSVILATSRIPDDALYRELKERADEWADATWRPWCASAIASRRA